MIIPKVGAHVLFHPFNENERLPDYQPHAAIVTYVHNDRLVNLAAFNSGGGTYARENVELLQDDDRAPNGKTPFAEWVPADDSAGEVRPGWTDVRSQAKPGETVADRDKRLKAEAKTAEDAAAARDKAVQ